ncbi:MAG TPA: hypothetical protein VJP79_08765 [Nitrososphaera sp.]|nr:hypothetical protein [Nitrososphaera sp.]
MVGAGRGTAVREELVAKSMRAKKRFRDSLEMNHEKWHDGIGYDLSALDEMTEQDKDDVVDILSNSFMSEPWRTFEALEYINTPKALSIIDKNLRHPSLDVRIAASRFAKGAEKEREQILIEALEKSEFYEGLTQALDQIESFHPQRVIEALLRGLLTRGDSAAVNFAGMLLYLYGKAESSFDWNRRPLFLRFATGNLDERRKAFVELCGIIGIDPKGYY